jgi:hypothetical protein
MRKMLRDLAELKKCKGRTVGAPLVVFHFRLFIYRLARTW